MCVFGAEPPAKKARVTDEDAASSEEELLSLHQEYPTWKVGGLPLPTVRCSFLQDKLKM